MTDLSLVTLRCGIHHAAEITEFVRGMGGRRLTLALGGPVSTITFETDRPDSVLGAGVLSVYGVDVEVTPTGAPPARRSEETPAGLR